MNNVILDGLPKRGQGFSGRIDWRRSVGSRVAFSYQGIKDTFKILDYYARGRVNYLKVLYLEKEVELPIGNIKNAKFGRLKEIHESVYKTPTGQWSQKEKEIIHNYFPYVTTKEMQQLLPSRTVASIQTMAQRLGVRKNSNHILKVKRQNSLAKCELDKCSKLDLCFFFERYKKSLNGENVRSYGSYSSMKREWVVLLFKYYLRKNNLNHGREFWTGTVIGSFLQKAKLKTAVKKCFDGYYDFLIHCFPQYRFREWEFTYLNVRDGFWDEVANQHHCIREGIIKMKKDGIIKEEVDCLELHHSVLSSYISSSLITYKGKHCIVDYFIKNNIEFNDRLYWKDIRFDSYEEKRLFLHITENYPVSIQKGNRRKHLYCNTLEGENYIPDLIITSVKDVRLSKPIVIEYFGMLKKNPKHETYLNYKRKVTRKIKFFESRKDIQFISIYPEDLKENYKGANKKLAPFLHV